MTCEQPSFHPMTRPAMAKMGLESKTNTKYKYRTRKITENDTELESSENNMTSQSVMYVCPSL